MFNVSTGEHLILLKKKLYSTYRSLCPYTHRSASVECMFILTEKVSFEENQFRSRQVHSSEPVNFSQVNPHTHTHAQTNKPDLLTTVLMVIWA